MHRGGEMMAGVDFPRICVGLAGPMELHWPRIVCSLTMASTRTSQSRAVSLCRLGRPITRSVGHPNLAEEQPYVAILDSWCNVGRS